MNLHLVIITLNDIKKVFFLKVKNNISVNKSALKFEIDFYSNEIQYSSWINVWFKTHDILQLKSSK